MQKIFSWFSLFVISLFTVTAQAAPVPEERLPTVEEVREVIFGDWQVMSFQREDGELVDYSEDNVIWSFNENYQASIQGAGFAPFESNYKVIPSSWGWIGIRGVFIVVKGLNHQMDNYSRHAKLIAKNLTDDGEMRIVNWEDDLVYTLKKVQ